MEYTEYLYQIASSLGIAVEDVTSEDIFAYEIEQWESMVG
jgi:hypothetical protein